MKLFIYFQKGCGVKTTILRIRHLITYVSAVAVMSAFPLSVFAEEIPVASLLEPSASTPLLVEQNPAPEPVVLSEVNTDPELPVPKPDLNYTYNAETGHWNSNKWQFDPVRGSYTKPQPAVAAQPAQLAAPTLSSATSINDSGSSSASLDSLTTNMLMNALQSDAHTGNATVARNGVAENATSGNALASAVIVNSVNSSLSSSNNQKAAEFTTDIMGDIKGDIMLQPMLLKAMIEARANQQASVTSGTTISTGLNNTVGLNATSGNATVESNTLAGDAKSGSAHAVANVMNIVNSMIAADQSFVGTINIYGNLDGDILIAPDFIPQLLSSNAPGAQTPGTIESNNTQSIVNNVSLAAASGQAMVTGNTKAGSAKSGAADTNLVVFNLTGHQVVAANSLLVFINVLGKWVGVIVDAPTGAVAAAVANGVDKNERVAPDLVLAANNNTAITNNIALYSRSGNAFVSGNTMAGSATSGAASASANIANISNSQFGLSGWFGYLFINVFGSWQGSFGIDTIAGTRGVAPVAINGTKPTFQINREIMVFVPPVVEDIIRQPIPIAIIQPNNFSGTDESSGLDGAILGSSTRSQSGSLAANSSEVTRQNLLRTANGSTVIITLAMIFASIYWLSKMHIDWAWILRRNVA